jgi:hypothetical protein
MKYWLSAALLANMALFLVEFHSGVFESFQMEEASAPRKEHETSSGKHKDAAGGTGLSETPAAFAGSSDKGLGLPHDAWPQIGQSAPQGNISSSDSPTLPLSSILTQTPGQAETPPAVSGSADAPVNKPVTSVGLSPQVELPPTQSPAAIPEQPKAPPAIQPAEYGVIASPAPAPLPVIPAAAKNASTGDKADPDAAPENPQKNIKAGTAQPDPADEKSGKAETPAHSSIAAAQSEKNKNAGKAFLAKESRPPQQTPHSQDKVLTTCYIAAPANSVEKLNTLLRQFRPQLTELAIAPAQADKARKRNRFVVYYPAPPSMEESLLTATLLKNNHGLKDLQVIRDGEMKGAISLGVFSNERNAQAAKSKFEQQGLQVRIKPRFPTDSAYKVRMRWTAEQEPIAEQLVDALIQSYPDTQRITSCE